MHRRMLLPQGMIPREVWNPLLVILVTRVYTGRVDLLALESVDAQQVSCGA